VDNLPVHPYNTDFMTVLISGADNMHVDFGSVWWDPYVKPARWEPMGIPFNVVPVTQAFVKVDFSHNSYGSAGYYDETDLGPGGSGTTGYYPIPPFAQIEGGVNASVHDDRHLIVLQQNGSTNCVLYEIYQGNFTNVKQTTWKGTSGAIFDLNSNVARPFGWTSADAAGLAIFPGLVKYDEVNNDSIAEITHAFRFTMPTGYIYSQIWPGSHSTNSTPDSYGCPHETSISKNTACC